ncbi:MAG: hydroxyethylthiazole kinase [Synergistaceae bacterium]|jgi:hydroxyethylthiazole kinase|nr:hydroxyethylthiazole kinase [Synergistaceae bacterium]
MNRITGGALAGYARIADEVREKKPLVHHITNYVTVNDCANITLAVGASPIMADSLEEAGDIAAVSSSLVLNIGTLNGRTIESMIEAGRVANKNGAPVVFDPVGAGASKFRNETAARILNEVKIGVLRGNISEIRFLAGLSSSTKGVDASEGDERGDASRVASDLARKLGCVVAVTGAVDTISDGSRVFLVENGHPALSGVTGTGCMCSSLVGSFCGAAPESVFAGAVSALLAMGISGEIAFERTQGAGSGSFHIAIIDAASRLNSETLSGRAKLYEA